MAPETGTGNLHQKTGQCVITIRQGTWVEEDDRLETGELGAVKLNVLQRQYQLVQNAADKS